MLVLLMMAVVLVKEWIKNPRVIIGREDHVSLYVSYSIAQYKVQYQLVELLSRGDSNKLKGVCVCVI